LIGSEITLLDGKIGLRTKFKNKKDRMKLIEKTFEFEIKLYENCLDKNKLI
jgi:hypothetical protein